MKIGIIGCFYDCADLLPQVLAPWISLKQQGAPLVLTAVNAQFKEYAELGYKNDDDATRALLKKYSSDIDFVHIEKEPLPEKDVRNIALRYLLEQKVDLVWILDGDEIYTEEQIRNIAEYVEKTPQFNYYHLFFDNRVFDLRSLDTFCPPRIFRTDRNGGITEFVFDNTIAYADLPELYHDVPGIVPKKVAFILHETWRKKGASTKINYHRKHFGFCPFTYDEDTNIISFDESYFKLYGFPTPALQDGYMETAIKRPANLVLDLASADFKTINKNVVVLLYALLCLERHNLYDIHLTIAAKPRFHASIQKELDLMPFASKLVESAKARTKNKNSLYVSESPEDSSIEKMYDILLEYFK